MSILTQLKQQLCEQMAQLHANQGVVALTAEWQLTDADFSLLGWLKAQSHSFPHYFLQHRDAPKTLIGMGQMIYFDDKALAQQFVSQTGFTLLGRVAFEGKACFILPRLMGELQAAKLRFTLYIDSDQLASEQRQLVPFFANFEKIEPLVFAPNTLLNRQEAISEDAWQAHVEQATHAINEHQFSKVVLANAYTLSFAHPISPYDLLQESLKTNLGCYQFLWAENSEQAFLGATPERLYAREGNQLFTEALAGTVAASSENAQTEANAAWLLNDTKNQIENQLVVEDIAIHLADEVDDFQVGQAEIKRLSHVQHLRRPIRTTLKNGVSDMRCLSRLHPTAAIAGLPRLAAKQFIAQTEPFKRNWYAGALGFVSPARSEFCVTLRSAQVHGKQLIIYAGAGIVAGSEPQAEWQEIARKSQAMIKLFHT